MTLHQRDASNALIEIGSYFVRDASNTLVEIGEEWVRDSSNVLSLVYSKAGGAFTVDVPPTVYGGAAFTSPIAVTTENATATVTGGRAPYTFLWERTDAALGDWSIISPTAAATSFRRIAVGAGENDTAEFACTVTDANGSSVASSDVLAYVENYGGLGGPIP